MRTVVATLKSISAYSQSRYYANGFPREEKEAHDAYERRTWRYRCHTNDEGFVVIPPMQFKNALSATAKFLSLKIPGKGNATWTKHFESGIMCLEALVLPIRLDDVQGEWLFVLSDGIRGSGKRVEKCFPLIKEWRGDVTFYIIDEIISLPVFKKHLQECGSLVGLGRFRPRNNGYYGRFSVEDVVQVS